MYPYRYHRPDTIADAERVLPPGKTDARAG